MKQLAFLFLITLAACSAQKSLTASKPTIAGTCPTTGTCTVEILKGKALDVNADNFGRPTYSLADNAGKNVVKFTYEKTKTPGYQDDFYTEEVVFETGDTFSEEALNSKEAKILFTVKCFCRGKAGTYSVSTAKAVVKDNILTLTIPPDIIENQLIKEIKIALK